MLIKFLIFMIIYVLVFFYIDLKKERYTVKNSKAFIELIKTILVFIIINIIGLLLFKYVSDNLIYLYIIYLVFYSLAFYSLLSVTIYSYLNYNDYYKDIMAFLSLIFIFLSFNYLGPSLTKYTSLYKPFNNLVLAFIYLEHLLILPILTFFIPNKEVVVARKIVLDDKVSKKELEDEFLDDFDDDSYY